MKKIRLERVQMKLTFAKFIMQTLLKITFFIHTLVEHKISGNGPMIVHRRKSIVIGIRTKSTHCEKKYKLTFNNLNFNFKYLMRFFHFWIQNLDTIQDFLCCNILEKWWFPWFPLDASVISCPTCTKNLKMVFKRVSTCSKLKDTSWLTRVR